MKNYILMNPFLQCKMTFPVIVNKFKLMRCICIILVPLTLIDKLWWEEIGRIIYSKHCEGCRTLFKKKKSHGCGVQIHITYLLTFVHGNGLAITAHTAQKAGPDALSTGCIFTQLACAPLYGHRVTAPSFKVISMWAKDNKPLILCISGEQCTQNPKTISMWLQKALCNSLIAKQSINQITK